ncbi:hypothetical protein RJ641_021799 [Dillenia turbinata]|uniref:Uncharacterized protein n=1 Tax=Dillenia turbinata TaxID=194707 RepID=A0AAN8YYS6_9MAGN
MSDFGQDINQFASLASCFSYDQLAILDLKLQACDLLDSTDPDISLMQKCNHLHNRSLKISALIISFAFLSVPVLVINHIELVSRSRRSSNHLSEEVSLNKKLAYRIDLFLSVYPYAKPLTLLVATLLLIFRGRLALFGVTDDSLADCLWLSWTFMVDLGNHANTEGFRPRLVSVSISFGGMLIFAMMLGLVSDAISEKFRISFGGMLIFAVMLEKFRISFGGMLIFAVMLGLVSDAISEKFDSKERKK